jgi:Rieske Fe-S protein
MTGHSDVHDIDRRRFLVTCAASACAFATTGCASLATQQVTALNGVIRLSLADHPDLAQPRGSVRVQPTGERDPLYVLALGDNRFAAVSPVCTHRGCTVELQDEHLVCPCHGSTYDRNGTVLRGPAEQPLRRYRVRVQSGVIEIALREPA